MLETGVDFKVSVANPNILHRLGIRSSEKTFVIKPLVLGTMLQIARELSSIDSDDLDQQKLIAAGIKSLFEHNDVMVIIVALAIRNSPEPPPVHLVRFLNKNLTSEDLYRLMNLVVKQMNVNPFLHALASVGILNPFAKKTKAIAQTSGEQSAASKNTSGTAGTKFSGEEVGETLSSSQPPSPTTEKTEKTSPKNTQTKSQTPEN